MMHEPEKSDPFIRAKKPANNPGQPGTESVEQREGAEGNTGQPRTGRTQSRVSVSQRLERVRGAACELPR
jgi:RNA-directed DNA polymerase